MTILETRDLKKYYGSGDTQVNALDGVDLTVEQGEFVAIVGTSGSGKSTLLHMLGGLDRPTSGSVTVDGKNIFSLKDEALTIFRRRKIGFVFQSFNLVPVLTVRENIEFGLLNARVPRFEIRERVDHALEVVGLTELAMRKPARMSGGQRQRVALARAIAKYPECFLMDEPLSNLDAKLRSDMRTELIQLHEELKSTFIYVTHDQIEAMTMGTNIVVMNEGRVMQQGSPTEIHNDPNCVFVAQFVGDPGMNIVAAGDYQVGFRPRDVEFDCADRDEEHVVIRRRVRSFENHGSEFLYLLDTPEKVFVKELSKRQRPLNEPFTVRIHRDDLYVFGRDGKRIYASEEVAKAYAEFKRNWQSV